MSSLPSGQEYKLAYSPGNVGCSPNDKTLRAPTSNEKNTSFTTNALTATSLPSALRGQEAGDNQGKRYVLSMIGSPPSPVSSVQTTSKTWSTVRRCTRKSSKEARFFQAIATFTGAPDAALTVRPSSVIASFISFISRQSVLYTR